MKNILGICDLHDSPELGKLTESRPLGAVTFLGRYGLIDFTLSNFSNSGIDKVAILVRKNYYAISSHVQSGQIWINNTKTGYQKIIFNDESNNELFNNDINNILKNKAQLASTETDYVVVAPAHFLAAIDFKPIIDKHIANKNEITVVYSHSSSLDKDFNNCTLLNLNVKTGKVESVKMNNGIEKIGDVSLDIFIFNYQTFVDLLYMQKNVSSLFSIKDMVYYYVRHKSINVFSYKFKGGVFPILSLQDYVKHSFDMLSHHNRQKLFLPNWPIYTTTHNTPPSLYGDKAIVKNCFIANGSIIKGKVENSIISRDVILEEGAEVKNCIIFTKTVIGKDVKLKYVLCDKSVNIQEVKELMGKDVDEMLTIAQGVNV